MYYKVKIGYNSDDYISIDNELDLQKILYAFIKQKKVILSDCVLDGKSIIWIKEDWNKEMGWSPTYKLGDDDWLEIRQSGVERKYKGYLENIKSHVNNLISGNKTDLIGKELLTTNLLLN